MADATFKIFRGDRDGGELIEYNVPVAPGMVVLDALHYIQAHSAPRSRRALELQSREVRLVLGGSYGGGDFGSWRTLPTKNQPRCHR